VDARILVKPADRLSPLHPVISPYPEQHESHETTAGGVPIFVRPTRPEAAPIFVDLFNSLSPTSVYYRFFRLVKSLTPDMLARFTQIDHDREIALVAIDKGGDGGRMLGVSRIIGDPDGKHGEFAILVGDPWHGKGIGAKLLGRCLQIAKRREMEKVFGVVLSENRHMLALARKLGFEIEREPGTSEYELTIDLQTVVDDQLRA
jgi:acetyltransferase